MLLFSESSISTFCSKTNWIWRTVTVERSKSENHFPISIKKGLPGLQNEYYQRNYYRRDTCDKALYTYICDGHTKQSLPVVVGGGKTLGFLELFVNTTHLIGHLVGAVDVSMGSHTSNHHLQRKCTSTISICIILMWLKGLMCWFN